MIEMVLIQGVIERGLIFSLVVIGVYLARCFLKFDNLAIEGAFGLGGAVTAWLLHAGFHPGLMFLAVGGVGVLVGIITSWLHTVLKLNSLLSGIIVTGAAFSCILKIAGSTLSLANSSTLFTLLGITYGSYVLFLMLAGINVILLVALRWFLTTQVGLLLQAAGTAPQVVTSLGKNVRGYITLGLIFSNTLAALAGSLFVQYVGYFSIWASVGVLIIGLVGMLLAGVINNGLTGALIGGSIVYQALIALTFELHIDPEWNKGITALLMILLIVAKRLMIKEHNPW